MRKLLGRATVAVLELAAGAAIGVLVVTAILGRC